MKTSALVGPTLVSASAGAPRPYEGKKHYMDPKFDTLRQQRDELYQDARSHPDSEADQMVQILLLSALRYQQAGEYDANLGLALAHERRGYRQARVKHIEQRRGAEPGDFAHLCSGELKDIHSEISRGAGGHGGARNDRLGQLISGLKAKPFQSFDL